MLRYGGVSVGVFGCFFSPSLVGESSLSLLLFKFMDISIGSMVWLSFVVNDCFVAVVNCFVFVVVVVVGFVVVVVVDPVVKIIASVILFSVVAGFFFGSFSPLFSGDLRPPFLIFFRIFLLVLGSFCWRYWCYDR